jgi:hypothetical protein
MEIADMTKKFRKEKGLSEAASLEMAHAMMATVSGKHPRLKITAMVIEGDTTIIVLSNDVQVKFDPSFPVAIWKYPTDTSQNPEFALDMEKRSGVSKRNKIDKIVDRDIDRYRTATPEAKAVILRRHKASSIEELETREVRIIASENDIPLSDLISPND